jgi:NTP pyrophosphatase (non-canonical NTP hydrolase)
VTANPKTLDVLSDVGVERARQDYLIEQGLIPWNCAGQGASPSMKLAVLTEEHLEVVKEVLEGGPDEALRTELIQLAAVAVAWAESL